MTSTRPYRPTLTPDEAIAEIRRCAGTQFDPTVTDAFIDVCRHLADQATETLLPATTLRSRHSRLPRAPRELSRGAGGEPNAISVRVGGARPATASAGRVASGSPADSLVVLAERLTD